MFSRFTREPFTIVFTLISRIFTNKSNKVKRHKQEAHHCKLVVALLTSKDSTSQVNVLILQLCRPQPGLIPSKKVPKNKYGRTWSLSDLKKQIS